MTAQAFNVEPSDTGHALEFAESDFARQMLHAAGTVASCLGFSLMRD